MWIKQQQLELDMKELTGAKLGKEYDKAVYNSSRNCSYSQPLFLPRPPHSGFCPSSLRKLLFPWLTSVCNSKDERSVLLGWDSAAWDLLADRLASLTHSPLAPDTKHCTFSLYLSGFSSVSQTFKRPVPLHAL